MMIFLSIIAIIAIIFGVLFLGGIAQKKAFINNNEEVKKILDYIIENREEWEEKKYKDLIRTQNIGNNKDMNFTKEDISNMVTIEIATLENFMGIFYILMHKPHLVSENYTSDQIQLIKKVTLEVIDNFNSL